MKLKSKKIILVLVIFLALTTHFACEEDEEEPGEPLEPTMPPLTDPIPYEILGFGKLVFQRTGPMGNSYSGVYVIDIDNRTSRGFSGSFDGPAVSPNGQKIAFSRFQDLDAAYDIHVMNIDGSNIQNVSFLWGHDRQPSWTPDSSQILFWVVSEASEYQPIKQQFLYKQSPVQNPGDRWLIKSFSQGTHPVPGVVWNIHSPFSVSPEWKLVFAAYLWVSEVSEYQHTHAILTMDIDGRNLQAIESSPPADAKYYSPAWSPDGQTIAYLLNFRDSNNVYTFLELIVMNADGSNPRSLAKFETNSTGSWSGQNDISLCWSPDGSKIAFNKKEEGHLISHIYIINPDGSGLTQVTFAEGVTDRSVSWSN